MTTLEALDHFESVSDPRWWPIPADGDNAVVLMAAAASLSGQLDDCCNDTELQAAVAHFIALLYADVFSNEQWVAEGLRIDGELAAWGQGIDAEVRRQAERN
jgi:hypothetical protein